MRIKNGQKSEKSKILILKDNESEKQKESFIIKEQESKTQDDPVKKIEIICEFCGKKIEAEVKLCPYCGTEL
jgi:hypothetical protein